MPDEATAELPMQEPEPPTRETAESMRRRICEHFPAQTHAVLFEVRNATGYAQKRRTGYCDALVMGLWPSRGLEMWGIEIKVSRSDWLRELKAPEKCDEFFRYCHRWFVVAPANVVKPEELPPTWGLMVPTRDTLRGVVPAPFKEPQPADVGLLAAICRASARSWKDHPEYLKAQEQLELDVEKLTKSRVERAQSELVEMAVKVAEFQAASGVTVCDSHSLGGAIRHLPADHEARSKIAAALAVSDRALYYRHHERIGAAVRLVLDGGVDHMRDQIASMIKTSRNVTDAAEKTLAEFDARQAARAGGPA